MRLLLEGDLGPVAGLVIKGDIVDQIYVHSDCRRQGLASRLLEIASLHFGDLEPSKSQTADGQAFVASLSAAPAFSYSPGFSR